MKDGKPWRQRRAEQLAARGKRVVAPKNKPAPRVAREHNPHRPRGIRPWSLEGMTKLFDGQTVVIVGGGPSLRPLIDDGTLKKWHEAYPDVPWIVVNNAYKIAPWARILHFADCQWWRWNSEHVLKNWPQDRLITTATSDVTHVKHPRVKRFWRDRNKWSFDPQKLHGWDSGTQAVNMAYHLGAKKIILLGFDMQPARDPKTKRVIATQFHNEHQRDTAVQNYERRFAPVLRKCIEILGERGISVVRSTNPGLSNVPFVAFPEAAAPEALTSGE